MEFFLLQDLVTDDRRTAVKFFMPFDDFSSPSVPRDVATYQEYRRRSIEFVQAPQSPNRAPSDGPGPTGVIRSLMVESSAACY